MSKRVQFAHSYPLLPSTPPAETGRIVVFGKADGFYGRLPDGQVLGPFGAAGAPVEPFTFTQQTASATWLITHAFPYRPAVDLYDSNRQLTFADVTHVNDTTVLVEWAFPSTGSADLR